ncbi:MAG: nuclear transport factor 2 family protein [Solirubrobacterales bacterium]
MSQQDVELARRAYEAWNEGGAEMLRQFLAEDFEFRDPPNLPDSRVVRGRDAAAAYLASQVEVIGDMKFTIVEVKERGRSVVLRMKLDVHGAGSGLVLPGELMQVIEVAQGGIQRLRGFFEWEQALEAAAQD